MPGLPGYPLYSLYFASVNLTISVTGQTLCLLVLLAQARKSINRKRFLERA
ncbi:MAG: hypothetical protein FWC60_05170 [Firmicutes bacterium]|nr:hypothetical protein [Bacillota bacterium]